MNKVISTIKSRVSCREYSDKKVSKKNLNEIVECAKSAPSAMNRQIVTITVISKKSLMDKLRKLSTKLLNRDCMYGANTIIIVSAPRDDRFAYQDCSCVLENIFLSATALKISSCWINQFDELLSNKEALKLRKKLEISEDNVIVGSAILGYQKENTQIGVKDKSNIKVIIK